MNPQRISMLIAKKGYSVSLIAEAIDRSPGLASKIINRKAKSYYAAHAIAKILDLPVSEVFPDVHEYAYDKAHNLNSEERAIKIAKLKALIKE